MSNAFIKTFACWTRKPMIALLQTMNDGGFYLQRGNFMPCIHQCLNKIVRFMSLQFVTVMEENENCTKDENKKNLNADNCRDLSLQFGVFVCLFFNQICFFNIDDFDAIWCYHYFGELRTKLFLLLFMFWDIYVFVCLPCRSLRGRLMLHSPNL